ncbi:MAG TPA: heme o synthase [Candidatus Saccharimonadales bacterium]|nr:heme o synthase [Candidatus Saccharimonadales bacterium]
MSLRVYYQLTKPGIIYGNALPLIAGFLLASKRHIDLLLLLMVLVGASLVIASGCVFNNWLDRGIDRKMARTQHRALAQGTIPGRNAIAYAVLLAAAGFTLLLVYTNVLVVVVGATGLIDYIVLYGFAKRHSVHGTLVGSIAGATPPLAGYLAVTDHVDLTALLLFLILAVWQMPHFYAIALYRLKDYRAAGLPVLPVKKGLRATKISIVAYIVAFTACCVALSLSGHASHIFLVIMLAAGLWWLWPAIKGFVAADSTSSWARGLFLRSLVVLCVYCTVMGLNVVLP